MMEISVKILAITFAILIPLAIIHGRRVILKRRRVSQAKRLAVTIRQHASKKKTIEIEDEWIYDLQETKRFYKAYK